jgi:Tfp pilus assembly protein PilN
MVEVNLLPVAEEIKPKSIQKGLGFAIPKVIPRGFAAAVAVLALLYVYSSWQASAASRSLENNNRTLRELTQSDQQAKAIELRLPTLRERAAIFQIRLEQRKLWSALLQEITLCCPEKVQLTEISLSVGRGALSISQQSRELLIKGSYLVGEQLENSEMLFTTRLQSSKIFSEYYPRVFIASTDPQATKTDFVIRCSEQ